MLRRGQYLADVLTLLSLCCTTTVCAADRETHAARMQRGMQLFRGQVRPLLVRNCLECHGGTKPAGGLNLSSRKSLLAGGRSGVVVVAGQPDSSLLLKLIQHRSRPHMPRDRPRLSDQEIAAVRNWILNGAPYDGTLPSDVNDAGPLQVTQAQRMFWSFRPLRTLATANHPQHTWCRTPIDSLLLTSWQPLGMDTVAPASRAALIRRATITLLGLPPSPEDIDAFLADRRPDAWSRLVERLLGNPHYGERWARHWLDVVRFAESYGFEHDLDNLNAYHYRDFVIRALNDDMPFDQFVRWQIAGDELAADDPLAWMATGFLAAGVRNADIAKVRVEQERYDELDDIVSTTGTALLGLSIGCARCHDHKYDPISQENYYRFLATFERTVRGEVPLAVYPGQTPIPVLVAGEGITPLPRIYNPPPAFYDQTWFLDRGDVHSKAHRVQPGFLEVLTTPGRTPDMWQASLQQYGKPIAGDAQKTYRRSRLAAWLTDTRHGAGALLARVIVNRLWQHHFGRGIVATPNDFGSRGDKPTHPDLLEWLAAELVRSGWSIKHMHRIILSTAAWRQAVVPNTAVAADVDLFHGRRIRRMEAEVIRDAMLTASGELEPRMYGPGILTPTHRRRSAYYRVKRSQMIPLMTLFDAPEALQSVGRRSETTVAPQALALINAHPIRELAEAFADRLLEQLPASPQRAERSSAILVDLAYRRSLGRRPTDEESQAAIDFLGKQQAEYRAASAPATSPPASKALLIWLDASTQAAGQTSLGPLRQWRSRGIPLADRGQHDQPSLGFNVVSESLPTLRAGETPLQKPAVRFGPAANVLRCNDRQLNFGTGDFSISVLFRIDADAGDDHHILGKDNYAGSNTYSGYFLQYHNQRLKFCTRRVSNGQGQRVGLLTAPLIRKGRWYRATGVRRRGVLSLYLDDEPTPQGTLREPEPVNIDNMNGFKLGDMDEHPGSPFQGAVAELLVFQRGLTAQEVAECHAYLRHKYIDDTPVSPLQSALTDLCQALFCLNEFIYVE